MPGALTSRRVIRLREKFFCDGAYYVFTSSSLGGSGLTAEDVASDLGAGDEAKTSKLLKGGVCIPVFFPGDCAFDNAIVVIGDLTEQEENEWIGRITAKLDIPCGKLVVLCGGGEEDFMEAALSGEGFNGYKDYFQIIDVEPGKYLVEILAYVSSMTVDFYFEEGEPLDEWFHQTRPGADLPKWLQSFKSAGFIGELSDELVSYILRLSPLLTEPPLPELVDEIGWCGEFEFRRPAICPLGIPRDSLLKQ